MNTPPPPIPTAQWAPSAEPLQNVIRVTPPLGGSPSPEPPTLSEYFKIFKKRLSLILTISGSSLALALLYCLVTPSVFTADTIIEIRGHAPILANSQSETLLGSDTRKVEYLKTTVAKLKLEGLADEVLSKGGLAEELREYWDSRRSVIARLALLVSNASERGSAEESMRSNDSLFMLSPRVLNKYLALIDITPIHETNLVTISATTADPELSQKLANAHATGFINHLQKERQEAIAGNLQLLQRQAQELKGRVTTAEEQLSSYAAANKIFAAADNSSQLTNSRQIDTLSNLLAEATGRRIKTESLLSEVSSKKIDELAVTDDETTRQLRSTLQMAQAEYATLGSRVTAAYPTMVELRAKVDSLKQSIADERKRIIRTIQSQLANERNAESRLRDQIEAEKEIAQDMSGRMIQYNVLAKEASSLRDLYQTVLKQVKEIEISASSTSSNVFVTDFATVPTTPSAPKTNLIVTLFVILGVCLGLVAALILEAFDNTLKTSDDVQSALELPFLGGVPEFDHERFLAPPQRGPLLPDLTEPSETDSKPSDQPATGVSLPPSIVPHTAPHDIVSESLRTIRAGILLSSADNPPRVIMITSATKGEGKTTVLYNLAATLSQASHRTIMIDGDLRERGLTKLFCKEQGPGGVGLSNYLAGQAQLDQVVRPTPVEGLDILPAGSRAPNPAELLSSTAMRDLVSQLAGIYDFVLVDSPPILPVADGLTLSRIVDSVVLVVRSRTTERTLAQESRRRLLRVNARILGVVLNDLEIGDDQLDRVLYGGYATGEESIIT